MIGWPGPSQLTTARCSVVPLVIARHFEGQLFRLGENWEAKFLADNTRGEIRQRAGAVGGAPHPRPAARTGHRHRTRAEHHQGTAGPERAESV